MPATTDHELLLSHEVAAIFRLSQRQLRQLVAAGKLRPVRFSPRGHFRFRREEIERILRGEVNP